MKPMKPSVVTTLRTTARIATGLTTAAAAFLLPGAAPGTRDAVPAQPDRAGRSDGFRLPDLVAGAHASMHVSTIANLTTVLRFKAAIMTKSTAEIGSFIHKLHHEAAAARKSNDAGKLLISTKRLMVMTDALRERIEGMEKARK